MIAPSTISLLRHLAGKPGHDEVKADFRQLLTDEFGAELSALDFERRVPEVRGRLDALIGRTILEAKGDLAKEWPDVEHRMPDYLGDREREEGEKFIGIASDGRQWAACELENGRLVKIKEIILDPEKPGLFLAWLDGVVALKASLPPDPLTIRIELGQDSVAFRRGQCRARRSVGKAVFISARGAETATLGTAPKTRLWTRGRERCAVVPAHIPRHRCKVHRARRSGLEGRRPEAFAFRRRVPGSRDWGRRRKRFFRLGSGRCGG